RIMRYEGVEILRHHVLQARAVARGVRANLLDVFQQLRHAVRGCGLVLRLERTRNAERDDENGQNERICDFHRCHSSGQPGSILYGTLNTVASTWRILPSTTLNASKIKKLNGRVNGPFGFRSRPRGEGRASRLPR